MPESYVYILTNDRRTVLYTGCTSDLKRRLYHHKHRLIAGFTKKYNVDRLVYFEVSPDLGAARVRERAVKGICRDKKVALINAVNPLWRDLYGDLVSIQKPEAGTTEATRRDPSSLCSSG